jgi:MarR family
MKPFRPSKPGAWSSAADPDFTSDRRWHSQAPATVATIRSFSAADQRGMRTHADQMACEHGLTRAQWIILVRLERQPDLSQNELAAIAEVAPITVARLVDRLELLARVGSIDF